MLPEVWKREICDGLDSVFVARTLAERGMLKCNEIGKLQSVVWVQSKARRVYALTAEIL